MSLKFAEKNINYSLRTNKVKFWTNKKNSNTNFKIC